MPRAVRIGGVDRQTLLQRLHAQGVRLNPAGEALFQDARFTTLSEGAPVDLAAISIAELGFGEGATYALLIERAKALGLFECPLELGPHLRLAWLAQSEGSTGRPTTSHRAPSGSITIASRPLDDVDETPKGFYLRRIEGSLWLRGYMSWSGHVWSPEDVLVFSRGRAAEQAR